MFEFIEEVMMLPKMLVIGVGDGGESSLAYMMDKKLQGVSFLSANTSERSLHYFRNRNTQTIQLGAALTQGLGTGADVTLGKRGALDSRAKIAAALSGMDMVFIAACLGGGTGSGAAPVIAQIAKELHVLTVAVVTCPFPWEGKKRSKLAQQAIDELVTKADATIVLSNGKLLPTLTGAARLADAFDAINDVLYGVVKSITDLFANPGQINVDFADVRTVLTGMGLTSIGTGRASGAQRAQKALALAMQSPLLETNSLKNVRGLLVNITFGEQISLGEFQEIGDSVHALATEQSTIVIGTAQDQRIGDALEISLIAAGSETPSAPTKPIRRLRAVTSSS